MKKLLPDTQRLQTLREEGLTHKQIAEWVESKTGVKVAPTSVAAALSRAGLTQAKRYDKHLPWTIKKEHDHHYAARMLRLMGRRDNGGVLDPSWERRLNVWLRQLEEQHAVVAYVPDSDEGFYYVDGDPIDGVPILPPEKVT